MLGLSGAGTWELIYVIVNAGLGSKVLRKAKKCGIRGGTIILGRGTVRHVGLRLLGIVDVDKEIVLLGANGATAERVLDMLDEEFQFEKPGHGIAFTTFVCSIAGSNIAGTRFYQCEASAEGEGVGETVYEIITVVVDKGKAEEVVDMASKAGARGGTVMLARGSGIHETRKVFAMDIEPEKEVVVIVSSRAKTEGIVTAIIRELRMDLPGNGIIFTQNANRVFGLYE